MEALLGKIPPSLRGNPRSPETGFPGKLVSEICLPIFLSNVYFAWTAWTAHENTAFLCCLLVECVVSKGLVVLRMSFSCLKSISAPLLGRGWGGVWYNEAVHVAVTLDAGRALNTFSSEDRKLSSRLTENLIKFLKESSALSHSHLLRRGRTACVPCASSLSSSSAPVASLSWTPRGSSRQIPGAEQTEGCRGTGLKLRKRRKRIFSLALESVFTLKLK